MGQGRHTLRSINDPVYPLPTCGRAEPAETSLPRDLRLYSVAKQVTCVDYVKSASD